MLTALAHHATGIAIHGAHVLWASIPTITSALRAASAALGFTIAIQRAIRYWRRGGNG